ncbi:MAG: hypothetical protein GY925_28150, partial [Actinomycetia bacterium]|nr:hypothetical protein [Actinomycetes bacterium]
MPRKLHPLSKLLAGLIAFTLVAAACGDDDDTSTQASDSTDQSASDDADDGSGDDG